MKALLIAIIFSGALFAAELPPVIIKAKVDKAKVTTGDLFTYTVTLDVDKKFSVTLPELGGSIASFRVVDFGKDDPIEEEGRVVSSRWYQLQADLTGSYILPALEVKYKNESGEEVSAKTSEIFVEVESVLKKDGEKQEGLRGIKDLQQSDRKFTLLSYIIMGMIALIIALVVFLWFRTRREKLVPETVMAPHEIALRDLKGMKSEDLEVKPYYFKLTDIFKRYFEGIFDKAVTDMTYEEMSRLLSQDKVIAQDLKDEFLSVMKDSQLAKFSDYVPEQAEQEKIYERVCQFVEKTMPQTQEEESGESVI